MSMTCTPTRTCWRRRRRCPTCRGACCGENLTDCTASSNGSKSILCGFALAGGARASALAGGGRCPTSYVRLKPVVDASEEMLQVLLPNRLGCLHGMTCHSASSEAARCRPRRTHHQQRGMQSCDPTSFVCDLAGSGSAAVGTHPNARRRSGAATAAGYARNLTRLEPACSAFSAQKLLSACAHILSSCLTPAQHLHSLACRCGAQSSVAHRS